MHNKNSFQSNSIKLVSKLTNTIVKYFIKILKTFNEMHLELMSYSSCAKNNILLYHKLKAKYIRQFL